MDSADIKRIPQQINVAPWTFFNRLGPFYRPWATFFLFFRRLDQVPTPRHLLVPAREGAEQSTSRDQYVHSNTPLATRHVRPTNWRIFQCNRHRHRRLLNKEIVKRVESNLPPFLRYGVTGFIAPDLISCPVLFPACSFQERAAKKIDINDETCNEIPTRGHCY